MTPKFYGLGTAGAQGRLFLAYALRPISFTQLLLIVPASHMQIRSWYEVQHAKEQSFWKKATRQPRAAEVAMGCQRQDRLYSSSSRAVHQECQYHRQVSGFEKSFTGRTGFRVADAYLLHQSCRARLNCQAAA